ncbi:MAG: hypothetical protein VCB26_00950, partial [Candidatus Hydrogenedentota bacterium]
PDASEFYRHYYDLCEQEFPNLRIEYSGDVTSGVNEVYFSPTSLPDNMRLIHSTNGRWVGLQIHGSADELREFEQRYSEVFPESVTFEIHSTQARAKIDVPQVLRTDKFQGQEEEIRQALRGLTELENFVSKHVVT